MSVETADSPTLTAEVVAKLVAGIAQIGVAHRALQETGHTATITGNRIIVAGAIEAQLLQCNGQGVWSVFALDGTPPVWTVGTMVPNVSSWVGAE